MNLFRALSRFCVPLVLMCSVANAGELKTHFLDYSYLLDLRVGVQAPDGGDIVGDVLFLPGFGDRLENHPALFNAWNAAGFRVISFDYPSHGGTRGLDDSLNDYDFSDLASMAKAVETDTRASDAPKRPLILSGWSTGGLLAVRMVQAKDIPRLERRPVGLILFTPGIAVYPLVGEYGIVTASTLTDNPNPVFGGPISPRSPLEFPFFAGSLLFNSYASQIEEESYPKNLPTLIMIGGNETDKYANSPKVVGWVRAEQARGASISAIQCTQGFHMLDDNRGAIGAESISSAVQFAKHLVNGGDKVLGIGGEACPAVSP